MSKVTRKRKNEIYYIRQNSNFVALKSAKITEIQDIE